MLRGEGTSEILLQLIKLDPCMRFNFVELIFRMADTRSNAAGGAFEILQSPAKHDCSRCIVDKLWADDNINF